MAKETKDLLYAQKWFEGKLGWIVKEKIDDKGGVVLYVVEQVTRLSDSDEIVNEIIELSRQERVAPKDYAKFAEEAKYNYRAGNYDKYYEETVSKLLHKKTREFTEKNREAGVKSGKGEKYELSFTEGKSHCSFEFTKFKPLPENEEIGAIAIDKNAEEVTNSIREYNKKNDLNTVLQSCGTGPKDTIETFKEETAKVLSPVVRYERQTKPDRSGNKLELIDLLIEPKGDKVNCQIDDAVKNKIYMPWAKDLCKTPNDLKGHSQDKLEWLNKQWENGNGSFLNRIFGMPFLPEQRIRLMEYLQDAFIAFIIGHQGDGEFSQYDKLYNWPGAALIYKKGNFNGRLQQGFYSPKLYRFESRTDWSWLTGQEAEENLKKILYGMAQKAWLDSIRARKYAGTRTIKVESKEGIETAERIANTYSITGPFSKKLYGDTTQ